ncbi:MAG TPA: serine hydrolase domain-containing protein [Ideonella sp.]|uniref:serine hydrolase domain-containing protein n=1 Tax=Ideonella sp. TaxID=1929293 RepID=UPI002BC9982E|nr:serine hydrolase domain-containing protein [Ideonella sp.]HSI48074.1 serine hydrolase domain-containing protein [Ideonella sp.]
MHVAAQKRVVGAIIGSALSGCAFVQVPSVSPHTRYDNALRQAVAFEGAAEAKMSLADRMARWKVPGVSVAIIDDCRIVEIKGFGVAGANGRAVRTQTIFQAASVTKPVAAFAALRLVDKGVLSLDEDVNLHLQAWKVPHTPLLTGHPVTLRSILSHSAGLVPGGYGGYRKGSPIPTLLQTLDGIEPARPKPVEVAYTPGSEWRYAGGGYLVAQLLMTEKTGKSFDSLMRDEVFLPTGMQHSGFEAPDGQDVAVGHVADGSEVPGGWHIYPELAAASLWTTAPDLALFGVVAMKASRHDRHALLSPGIADLMTTAQIGSRSLGFVVGGEGQNRHFGHDGTNVGYNSSLILYPATCQGAAILTNSDNAKPLIAELLRGIADAYSWPDAMATPVVVRTEITASVSERFVGTYAFADIQGVDPFRIIHGKAGEDLIFDRGDGHREPLYATAEGLVGPDSGITIKAVTTGEGPARTITYARIGRSGSAKANRLPTPN